MTSGRATRESRQQKAAELRAQAARAEARRRTFLVSGVAVVVIVVIVVVFVVIQSARRSSDASAGPNPANIGSNYSITVGNSSAPVTVVAYEDFQCPICREFEAENATQLKAYVKAGTVKMEYRPIAFLDRSSTTNYSTRSLNAAAALVASTPTAFQSFHDLLYANQPAEGSAGLPNSKLITLAEQAGAPTSIATAINAETYKGWTVRATNAATDNNITGTPTVIVNGATLKTNDAATVKAAIDSAAVAAKK